MGKNWRLIGFREVISQGLQHTALTFGLLLQLIEVLCQQHESEANPVLVQIMDILYQTEVCLPPPPHSITPSTIQLA